ncbi:serine hydrolase [uncultured Draconibacterium sp.]|uniref:serine hydrolase n=1 Tax=uncultured Draconibacterium sp. TaxID=1573823 RepID=UPI0032163B11
MKKYLLYLFVFVLFSCESDGQHVLSTPDDSEISLPFKIKREDVKPLWSLANNELQTELQTVINAEPKWKRLVQQNKMAVGLVLLNDTSDIKFARINGSNIMYAASLPKIAILLAAMDALDKGEIEETEELRNDMRLMIARSDNAASTRTMDLLGFEKIEKVLTDPNYLLYDEENGGGLWVGKRYAKTGRRYPEPIKGISHAATVTQVCRFYYLLINGQLVNFDRSSQMLDIMENPEIHHKFVNSLEKVAPKAKLFRKSGSWQNYHADSILVWGPERKYILVALTEDPDGEKILRNLALKIDNIIINPN